MNTLIIFTKAPIRGKVKTRLQLSLEDSLKLQRCFIKDTIKRFSSFYILVFYHPEEGISEMKEFKCDTLFPQKGRDFGERLYNSFLEAKRKGAEKMVGIGTDSPTLPESYVRDAFELLDSCDLVLGPNIDGGYYLIGMCEPYEYLFSNISWGTSEVLSQSLEEAKGLKLGLLPVWYDVDEPWNLRFLRTHLEALRLSSQNYPENTFKFLRSLKL